MNHVIQLADVKRPHRCILDFSESIERKIINRECNEDEMSKRFDDCMEICRRESPEDISVLVQTYEMLRRRMKRMKVGA